MKEILEGWRRRAMDAEDRVNDLEIENRVMEYYLKEAREEIG